MSYSTGQEWGTVSWNKARSGGRIGDETKEQALNRARRQGMIETQQKQFAGGNKSAHTRTDTNMRKLEEDSENFKHATVDRSLSRAIMQARLAKQMNQKTLATAINEKPQVVAEYESGKAIPNNQIIMKLERILGCQLPRSSKKKPST